MEPSGQPSAWMAHPGLPGETGTVTGVSTLCQRRPIIRQDANVSRLAAERLPALEHHKEMAVDLMSKRKVRRRYAGGDQLSGQDVFVWPRVWLRTRLRKAPAPAQVRGLAGNTASIEPLSVSDTRLDLVRPDTKARQKTRSKSSADCNVSCVSSARHQDPSYAWSVMACVERIPRSRQIGLKPGREIHWKVNPRDSNVAQIPGAVPRWDV